VILDSLQQQGDLVAELSAAENIGSSGVAV
jgi:hypothetical protein